MFQNRDLKRLIIPLVIEQTLAVTIGMADTVMVSSAGEAAVSGISLVDSINVLLINIFSALATGGAVISSQFLGRNDRQNACSAGTQLLISITVLSLAISVLALIFRFPLLRLIFGSVEDDVMANAQIYFLLTASSYPFLAIYNAGAALFRSMGNSKISMYTSILMNVINIGGNAILIFGFQMGTAGAGTATLVSRIVGAAAMMVLLRHRNNPIFIDSYLKLEFRPSVVHRILTVGIPNGMESGMFQIGKLLLQSLISSFGTAAIAANAVGNSISSVTVIPGSAISLALITVVGQCVGARDYDEAKRLAYKLMKIASLSMLGTNLLVFLLLDPLIGCFQLSQTATKTAHQLMQLYCICSCVFWTCSFSLPNALRAAGDVRFPMMVSIFSMAVFRIGFSYLLGIGFQMGVLGVWVAMILDWIFRDIMFITRFLRGKWKNFTLT